jgi:hypothetical protein
MVMGGSAAGVVMTDEEYADAALGACRRRRQLQQDEEENNQEKEEKEALRRRTRSNLSGPKRFAPAFAGRTLVHLRTCYFPADFTVILRGIQSFVLFLMLILR